MLGQIAVVEEDGGTTIYSLWMRYFTSADVTALLERHGFMVEEIRADLTGNPLTPEAMSLGIIARRG